MIFPMMELPKTIADAAHRLRDGSITAQELTQSLLERCYAAQDSVAAFITINDAAAIEAARKADADFACGVDRGPLQGIPVAVKDNIATADMHTTANSKVLDPSWGDGWDATVVTKLRAAGAVVVGKLGLYEFAVGHPDASAGFPLTRNPWNLDRIPGGSSSGTGAAVAAGLILGGLGTDTGGSIRVPAAYCGITALRPTFGRVSQHGCVPVAYSLDTIGPMTRNVRDCALMLQTIAGYDPQDPSTVDVPVPDMSGALDGSLENVRLGLPTNYFFESPQLDVEIRSAILTAIEDMAAAGATIVEVYVPHVSEAYAAWWTTTHAEAYAYHEPDLRQRPDLYSRSTRQSMLTGALFTAADYIQAQRMRLYIEQEYARTFTGIDALVAPNTIGVAPIVEDWDFFTTPSFTSMWSLVGYPALTVGCGFAKSGLPLSMQLVGKPFAEPLLLKIGDAYQRITDWHTRTPNLDWEVSGRGRLRQQ